MIVGPGSEDFPGLSRDAILVKIGDRECRKGDVEQFAAMRLALMQVANPMLKDGAAEGLKARLCKIVQTQFVPQSLYLNAARQAGIEATSNDLALAQLDLAINYGGLAVRTFKALKQRLPKDVLAAVDRQLATDATILAYWKSRAPEAFTVPYEEFVGVTNRVRELQKQSVELLAQQRKLAADIYGQLQKGTNFVALSRKYSVVKEEDEHGYVWGEFLPSAIPYPELIPVVAKLKPGDVAAPIELDDGIHIIKLLKRTGAGAVSEAAIQPEEVSLGRIVLNLPKDYEIASEDSIRKNWRDQKLMPLQKEWLAKLRAEACVEYPSGTNLWTHLNKKDQSKKGTR